CSLLTALAPKSSLFPYTTLFRSGVDGEVDAREDLPSLDRGVEVLDLQQRMLAQPTLPSRLIPSNRCASTANSIGSSLKTSLQKRSEEHTSELQSLRHLVCRLLLE